jgi:hypothetical protein
MLVLINRLWGKPFFVHISHFLFFLSLSFFTLPLHQVPRSSVGNTTDVMGEVVVEVEKYPIVEQQVQHLNHFLSILVIFNDFYLSHFL